MLICNIFVKLPCVECSQRYDAKIEDGDSGVVHVK